MHLVLSYKSQKPQARSSSFQTWLIDTNPRDLPRFDGLTIQHLLTYHPFACFSCFNEPVCDGNIATTTEISSTVDKRVQMSECLVVWYQQVNTHRPSDWNVKMHCLSPRQNTVLQLHWFCARLANVLVGLSSTPNLFSSLCTWLES